MARSSEQPVLPAQPEPERPAGRLESAAAVGANEPAQAASSPEDARVATAEPLGPEPRAEAQAQRGDRAVADAPAERDQVVTGAMAKAADDLSETPAAPASAALPAARAAARSSEEAQVLRQAAGGRAPAREIVSPDPAVRWRVGAAGLIERSIDNGSTWVAQQPGGVTADLLEGSAPTPIVCWVVGRAGTVLISTDGRQWRRVAFPETIDLVAVQATDERTAVVTTADGRRFRTSDAGLTWE
jgi:hypothetical protein